MIPQSKFKLICPAIVFLFLLLKNLSSLDPLIGDIIVLIAALISCFDPRSFFVYIAGSQIATDPTYIPYTLAQLLILCILITLPFNSWKFESKRTVEFIKYISPLFLWVACVQLCNGTFNMLSYNLLLAIIYSIVAIGFFTNKNVNPKSAILMMTVGLSLSLIGFIGNATGIEFSSIDYEAGFTRGIRIGAGRGDTNTAAVNLAVCFTSMLSIIFCSGLKKIHKVILSCFVIPLFVAAIISTGSRTGMFAPIIAATFLVYFVYKSSERYKPKQVLGIFIGMFVIILILYLSPLGDLILEKYDEIKNLNNLQSDAFGGSEIISGRSYMWKLHLDILKDSFLTGIASGDVIDFGDQYGVSKIGHDENYAAAHNTILEFMTMAGFPAGILFFILFAVLLYRSYLYFLVKNDFSLFAFGLSAFIVMQSISLPNWKTFWIWCVVAFLSSDSVARKYS